MELAHACNARIATAVRAIGFMLSAAILQCPAESLAQNGPIVRFFIGASAGGPVEAYARIVGDHMSKTLAQTIVYETRPGANGNLGAQAVLDQPADGHSIWVATQSMLEINPSVYEGLRWKTSDFRPLIKGVEAPIAIVVNPNVPAKTLDELIGWVKKNPGTLSFTSYSPGTPGHFLGIQMNEKFGLDMGHVPYRGSAQQVNDLIAGHAKIGFVQIASVLPFVAAGQLRTIATTGATRYGALPDTPTFTELGHPDFLATVWYGLVVRSTTPPEIVAKLLDAAKRAHADPQVRAALAPLGLEVSAVSGEELQTAIQRGTDHWARLVKLTGFKAAPD